MKNKTALATLGAIGAQIIFGFSFMFTKIALGFASPMTVIANRYMVAFLAMTVAILISKAKLHFGKNIWKLALMSLFQPVLYFLFESYGILLTTSSFSSVMISLIPIFSMISGIFILKELPTWLQYLFGAISVVGVIMMAMVGNTAGTVSPVGVLLLLGAVISSVAYNVASRKISAEFSAIERTYAMMLIGLIVFFTIALVENIHAPLELIIHFASPSYLAAVLYLGVLSSVAAFLMLNFANTHLPVAKTTVFANFTTVVSVIAGAVFLDEGLTPVSALGAIMIIVGVWGVQSQHVKKKQ